MSNGCASLAEGQPSCGAVQSSWVSLAFENDVGDGPLRRVRKRKSGVLYSQPGGTVGGCSVKGDGRTAARQAHDLAIAPAHAMIPARTQGLHGCLFGGKARRITFRAVCLRVAVVDFAGGINALHKAVSEAFDRSPDASNLRNINACADNHGFPDLTTTGRRGKSALPRPCVLL